MLKSDKNNGTSHEDPCTFIIVCRRMFLRKRQKLERK